METATDNKPSRKEERLREMLAADEPMPSVPARLVDLLIEEGRGDEALEVATAVLVDGSEVSREFYRSIAKVLRDGDVEANYGSFMGRIAEAAPISALIKFHEQFRDLTIPADAGEVILRRCATRRVKGCRRLLTRAKLEAACGDPAASSAHVAQALEAAGSDERQLLQVIQTSSSLGVVEVHDAARARYDELTGPIGSEADVGYSIVSSDGSLLGTNPDCEEGVILFKSFGRFWEASHPLVAMLTSRNVASLTVVDVERLAYVHGFGDSFPDIGASTEALSTMLATQGSVKRWHTMGFSAGGWAAMHYGAAIGAASATIFSGVSYIPLEPDDPDARGRAVARRIQAYEMQTGTDAREDLVLAPDLAVAAYYSASSETDTMHAERIGDLDNVTLNPIESETHAFWKGWTERDWVERLDELGIGVTAG